MSLHATDFQVPWPAWRAPAVKALRAMLGEIEGLAITGGESSVKFSPGAVASGRWLAGLSPAGVSTPRLMGLPERLGMPEAWSQRFRSQCHGARHIYLAVEQSQSHVVAKVYLEHALPVMDQRHRAPQQRDVALHIESCKWRWDAPQDTLRCTEYWRLSGIDGPGMVALLQEDQDVAPALQPVYASVADLLDSALGSAPDWHGHRLLLVREPGSARKGLGVRFYGSEWRVRAIEAQLSRLWKAWNISPEAVNPWITHWAEQELGWLHAGLDAQSQPYLTVYGALSPTQTRSVLRQANGASPPTMADVPVSV